MDGELLYYTQSFHMAFFGLPLSVGVILTSCTFNEMTLIHYLKQTQDSQCEINVCTQNNIISLINIVCMYKYKLIL